VLLEADTAVSEFRPPPVEELTEPEQRSLRSTLAAVIGGWPAAGEIAVQVTRVRRAHATDVADDVFSDGVWFRAAGGPVALGLTAEAAARVVCGSLGAGAGTDLRTQLSELDLAVLGAWAAQALREVLTGVGRSPGEVLRSSAPPEQLAGPAGGLVAELSFSGWATGAMLLLGEELLLQRRPGVGETVGDSPGPLLNAELAAEALIVTAGVPVSDLLQIEPGDVLVVGEKQAVEARLMAGSVFVARARPGARSGVRALRIIDSISSEDGVRQGDATDGC